MFVSLSSAIRKSALAFAVATFITTPVLAASWTVDHSQSTLGLEVLQLNQPFAARFDNWTADITFDPEALDNSSVSVTIETGSFSSDNPQRDQQAGSAPWLNASGFPTATFEVTGFSGSNGAYEAEGTLTIGGIAVPVILPFELNITDDTAIMTGEVALNRTDFGIGVGADNEGAVGPEVIVKLSVTATKA